jgi:hypothetical protein
MCDYIGLGRLRDNNCAMKPLACMQYYEKIRDIFIGGKQ